jgi:two-component system OmpR family response regulator
VAKILIVDDEARVPQALQRILGAAGHDVATALEGDAAVASGRRFQPDVIVADWLLGGDLTGIDVARQLRTHLPTLGTVIITGYPTDDFERDLDGLRPHQVVRKPFSRTTILHAVHAVLAERPEDQP